MTWFLLVGIVLTVVPLTVILGFLIFLAVQFVRDDEDAFNIMRFALGISAFGLVFIIAHFVGKAL